MAGCTFQAATVVTWIACRIMAEAGGDPPVSVMAAITLQAGDKMIALLAGGLGTVVAARTGARHTVMVKARR